jgi:predicted N-acyltransferase
MGEFIFDHAWLFYDGDFLYILTLFTLASIRLYLEETRQAHKMVCFLFFKTFDEYLSRFKSKRRVQIKKERKSVYEDQGIAIKVIRGTTF